MMQQWCDFLHAAFTHNLRLGSGTPRWRNKIERQQSVPPDTAFYSVKPDQRRLNGFCFSTFFKTSIFSHQCHYPTTNGERGKKRTTIPASLLRAFSWEHRGRLWRARAYAKTKAHTSPSLSCQAGRHQPGDSSSSSCGSPGRAMLFCYAATSAE